MIANEAHNRYFPFPHKEIRKESFIEGARAMRDNKIN
jgi:hypothetical protein